MPGAFPGSPAEQDTPTVPSKRIKTVELPKDVTPKSAAPIKVPTEEMHPKHLHQSTVKPREEARWLGFSNMAPATEPPKRNNKLAEAQATPSRTTSKQEHAFKSPEFPFTFRREQSLELSPEAKQLMEEKRAEALRIKNQMKSNGEAAELFGELDRKIAQPKTKKSRFSELHDAAFKKMDSIANHASAYRKDPSRLAAPATTSKIHAQTPSKSLKRGASKAELDHAEATPSKTVPRASSKTNIFQSGGQLKRAPSMKNLRDQATEEASPAKRVRRVETKEPSSTRPTSSSSNGSSDKHSDQPSTPQHLKESRQQPSYPNLDHLSTPTQSSLARASSAKSVKGTSKIPGSNLVRSPSKPDLTQPSVKSPEDATSLMARSPVKGGPFSSNNAAVSSQPNPLETSTKPDNNAAPLLLRSPAKGGLFSRMSAAIATSGEASEEKAKALMDATLARTPAKSSIGRPSRPEQDLSPSPQKKEPQAPLLARSPLKMSVAKSAVVEEDAEKQSSIPLLSQSPSKASQNYNPFAPAATQSPEKKTGGSLIGRFNMLRQSPIKSILRTPQRLYSDDPSKIAAGTHFATPPKLGGEKKNHGQVPATAPVRKHVDFSSSTKDPDALKNITSSDDSASPPADDMLSAPKAEATVDYPKLPDIFSPVANPTPDRRRQTIAPGDFTFRAGDSISFGTSSQAPPMAGVRGSTIRHVSAEPEMTPSTIAASQKKRKFDFENKINLNPAELSPTVTPGSKKRKFTFENNAIAKAAETVSTSDKENGGSDAAEDEGEARGKKRVKSVAPSTKVANPKPAPKTASRLPTLGVKPKAGAAGPAKDEKKKPSTSISMARLNALAMPKRRG